MQGLQIIARDALNIIFFLFTQAGRRRGEPDLRDQQKGSRCACSPGGVRRCGGYFEYGATARAIASCHSQKAANISLITSVNCTSGQTFELYCNPMNSRVTY